MKELLLTKGKIAIIDDEDFEYLNQWKWSFDGHYAVRGKFVEYLGRQNGHSKCRYKKIYMHREIAKTPDNLQTDHINRNKLDNRKRNLRNVTKDENNRNRNARKDSSTGFRGVSLDKRTNKYHAKITIEKRVINLGYFLDLDDAILIRKEAEQKYHAI